MAQAVIYRSLVHRLFAGEIKGKEVVEKATALMSRQQYLDFQGETSDEKGE